MSLARVSKSITYLSQCNAFFERARLFQLRFRTPFHAVVSTTFYTPVPGIQALAINSIQRDDTVVSQLARWTFIHKNH